MILRRIIPLLLRPRILGAVNRWRRGRRVSANLFRDTILIAFGIVVLVAIYRGTVLGLGKVATFADFAYLPPSTPLSVLLLFLFVMLALSSSVMSLGTFFLSQDNELILAAPVSRVAFFFTKYASVLLSTAWMPALFLLPFLFAFHVHYGGNPEHLFVWPIILLPYFAIPAAFAFIVSLVVITVIPPSQTRILFVLVVLGLIFFLVRAGGIITDGLTSGGDYSELFRILTLLSFPDALWLPSHWASLAFDELLEGRPENAVAPIGLLWSVSTGLLALGYLLFFYVFPFASSRSLDRRRITMRFFRVHIGEYVQRFLPVPSPALLLKDYRVLLRDMPQMVQLLLLLVIYLIYLYNLRVFGLLDALTEEEQASWLAFFFIANASMGAFITTATATRLVFPSVSLEGQSFWVLLTAPISLRTILYNKFWTWFIPIGCLSSITFTAGNIALGTGFIVTAATFVVGWFLSAALIALGLAIGAVFARYDWEHSAQLVASFGSFVFMLASILLITLNMVPLGVALFVREPGMIGEGMTDESWVILLGSCAVFIVLVNSLVVELSFFSGERALRKQLEEE